MRAVRFPHVGLSASFGQRMANCSQKGLWVERPRPLLPPSAAGSGGFAHLGRVVAIRDSRRPVCIRLLAENALKHPIVLLNVQAPLRSALFREDCLSHVE